ncbi:hypothetical protein [Pseudanabaena mucicola]|uniref:AMIN domain-containing protein n=1 Tax=Pseudanabaena mucicola FACHB-723 TaxID=2692860 RepID=A0ABR8A1Z4_9CYAN|nr:hypothetical protein [Pseudanabaena mucicola]MBD2189571.1 hypothetical protein [Pseudanabaena mucicola FACHB-723]
MNIFRKHFYHQLGKNIQKASVSLLAVTISTTPFLPVLDAIAAPSSPQIIAQVPQSWQTGVQLLRLIDNSGNLSSIGILLDIADKPATTYANAVYQLYVRRGGEWREVYTNSGARLISKGVGRQASFVEVISLSKLSERISLDDIYNGDLRAVTSVRYDLPNGVKDASFAIEAVRSFSSIVTTRVADVEAGRIIAVNSNISSTNSSSNTNTNTSTVFSDDDLGITTSQGTQSNQTNQNSQVVQTTNVQTTNVQTTNVQTNQSVKPMKPIIVSTRDDDDDEDDYYEGDDDERNNRRNNRRDRKDQDGVELSRVNPHRGHFSLAVLQSQPRFSQVIARISLKSKRPKGFVRERFVGDYRFNINERATFIRGLNPGDRLIVRLFDLNNRPLGYSEVQLLKDFSTISLILPSDPSAYGTLRTVSGIDSRRIGKIDRNVRVYDYFTQLQTTDRNVRVYDPNSPTPSYVTLTQTVVRFLTTSQGIPINLFNVAGLPPVSNQFTYTNAFAKGNQALINRTINVFTRDMPPAMQVLPGQLSTVIAVTNSTTTFDVVRKMLDYRDLRPNGIPTLF